MTVLEKTVLEKLGAFVAHAQGPRPDLPDTLARHVVDVIGAWIAGTHTPEGAALLRWRSALGEGAADAPLQRLRLDVATNCALARLSEIDDIHLASATTPGAIVVPAAVSISAALDVENSGALTAAVLAGYEVMIRFGRAVAGPTILHRGIDPTYFATPVTVAAVAARLLALDATETAHALALALTRSASGLGHHGAVTTSRWLATGQAAETGMLAALAARVGFTADLALLDGGFVATAYGIAMDTAALTVGLAEKFALGETSYRPWCAARQTIAAAQGMIEILGSGVAPEAIGEVKAFVLPSHRAMVDHGVTIGDRTSFLTSLPYQLAVAAVAPETAYDVAQAHTEVPEPIRAFMAKVTVEPDAALTAHYPIEWPARVEATTSLGRHIRTVTRVPGDPARRFDETAVRAKFTRFVAAPLGADAAVRLLGHAFGLRDGRTSAVRMIAEIESGGAVEDDKK
jgi:2-methylcitrate dehydratase PrpD